MKLSDLAAAAYSEYAVSLGNVNRGNRPLVPFSALELQYQRAWHSAVKQVMIRCVAEVGDQMVEEDSL